MQRFFERRLTPKWKLKNRFASFGSLVLIAALASPFLGGYAQQAAQQPKTPAKKKNSKVAAPDPVPPGAPLTVEFISRMLALVKGGTMLESRIFTFIDVRGLEFTATQDNLDKLKTAGASDDLLKRISTLSPPPPPPPPPVPVTGTLLFSCAPAECDIRIDGGPDKPTKNGKLEVTDLPFKQYTVDFRKEGYMPKSERVAVMGPSQPEIAVTLEMAAETRARWGAEMYKKCLIAIGGANGLTEIKNMTGTGAASSWDTAGALSEWSIKTVIAGNNFSYDLGNASSGTFSMACQGQTCGQKGGKSPFGRKKISGPEAATLNTNLVQYNRYHLLAVLERISGENHTLLANTAPSVTVADQHFIVDSRDESYDIALDGTFLPSGVVYHSKDGLASVKVTYAQYAAFEKGSKYPKNTSVLLPGEKQHGIQVRYEALTSSTK